MKKDDIFITATPKFLEEAALIPSAKLFRSQSIRKSSQLYYSQNKCAQAPCMYHRAVYMLGARSRIPEVAEQLPMGDILQHSSLHSLNSPCERWPYHCLLTECT